MNKDRIASLLASGLPPSQVATIVGLTPARISQLVKEDNELQNLLVTKQAELAEKDIEEVSLFAKYHSAEHKLLDQVIALAPISEMREVTAALRVVAERQEKAKTRQNPIQQSQPVLQQYVQILIPNHALPETVMNKENEIVEINQRNLAPLPSGAVTQLFSTLKKEKQHEPARIPAPSATNAKEALSEQVTKMMDSFHPAPYAEQF